MCSMIVSESPRCRPVAGRSRAWWRGEWLGTVYTWWLKVGRRWCSLGRLNVLLQSQEFDPRIVVVRWREREYRESSLIRRLYTETNKQMITDIFTKCISPYSSGCWNPSMKMIYLSSSKGHPWHLKIDKQAPYFSRSQHNDHALPAGVYTSIKNINISLQ